MLYEGVIISDYDKPEEKLISDRSSFVLAGNEISARNIILFDLASKSPDLDPKTLTVLIRPFLGS